MTDALQALAPDRRRRTGRARPHRASRRRPRARRGSPTGPTSGSRSRAARAPKCCARRRRGGGAGVTVNRVSQGSGAMLHSEAELAEMARIAADNGIEVSLFVGPREEWDIGRAAASADGGGLRRPAARHPAAPLRGRRHPAGRRAGHPRLPHRRPRPAAAGERDAGEPGSCPRRSCGRSRPSSRRRTRWPSGCWSASAASTVNVPSDLTARPDRRDARGQPLPIDLYVETPDAMGGVVRGHEAADLIDGGGADVRQVRAAQLAAALPQRPAPDRRTPSPSRGRRCAAPRSRWNGSPAAGWSCPSPALARPGSAIPEPAR